MLRIVSIIYIIINNIFIYYLLLTSENAECRNEFAQFAFAQFAQFALHGFVIYWLLDD